MKTSMLIEEFSFGNFRSFKDIQTLNMTAANIQSKYPELDTNNIISEEGKTSILKSKVIYGANASGKSNVVKALQYFTFITAESLQIRDALKILDSYQLSSETKNEPSFFQLIFRIRNIKYRYGFEATSEKIHSEWLYVTPKKRETPVFIREFQDIIELNETQFPITKDVITKNNKLFSEHTLLLSVAESFGEKFAENIVNSIKSILVCRDGLASLKATKSVLHDYLSDINKKKEILHLLKFADIGLNDIEIIYHQNNLKEDETPSFFIVSKHAQYDSENEKVRDDWKFHFDLYESEGTKELLYLSPLILKALEEGHPIIMDEFGSKLHPLLAKKILSLFNTPNSKSQLIVATHSTDLMDSDALRRDQIDFVEKDKYGASHLYSMVEIGGIRKDASYERDYLQGKYGAIPYLGNWSELSNICSNGEEADIH